MARPGSYGLASRLDWQGGDGELLGNDGDGGSVAPADTRQWTNGVRKNEIILYRVEDLIEMSRTAGGTPLEDARRVYTHNQKLWRVDATRLMRWHG
ncbi:hypothetical protein NL676_014404 [Syzygium grande]|nr:hypothetical protein NL676_014404 [Syzygium grande]